MRASEASKQKNALSNHKSHIFRHVYIHFPYSWISWNYFISHKLPGNDQDFPEFGKFPSKWKHCTVGYKSGRTLKKSQTFIMDCMIRISQKLVLQPMMIAAYLLQSRKLSTCVEYQVTYPGSVYQRVKHVVTTCGIKVASHVHLQTRRATTLRCSILKGALVGRSGPILPKRGCVDEVSSIFLGFWQLVMHNNCRRDTLLDNFGMKMFHSVKHRHLLPPTKASTCSRELRDMSGLCTIRCHTLKDIVNLQSLSWHET